MSSAALLLPLLLLLLPPPFAFICSSAAAAAAAATKARFSPIDRAVVLQPAPTLTDAKLLLSGVNGELMFVDAFSGKIAWSMRSNNPLLSTSRTAGLGIGSAEQIVVPGVDGMLYFAAERRPGKLEKLQVSVRDIVEAAPFRTADGTRFVANKQSHVLVVDANTGVVLDRFSADAWGTCDAAAHDDDEDDDDDDQCSMSPSSNAAMWIGRMDYTIGALDELTGQLRWNGTFSEITACVGDALHTQPLLDALPELYASADGRVWARQRGSGALLWSLKLASVLARVYLRVDSDIVAVKHEYVPSEAAEATTTAGETSSALVIQEPVLATMGNGQVFVIANTPSSSAGMPTSLPLQSLLLPLPKSPQLLLASEDALSERPVRGQLPRPDSINITLQFPNDPLMIAFSVAIAIVVSMTMLRLVPKLGGAMLPKLFRADRGAAEQQDASEECKTNSPRASSAATSETGTMMIGKISIQTRSPLGLGSHGTIVFDGYFEGRSVAVKRLQKHLFMHASKEVSFLIDSDRHPHVLRYFAREDDDNFIYVALERCRCSLADLVSRTVPTSAPLLDELGCPLGSARQLMQGMVSGVDYLHSINIVHRDLKPQNVLVTDDLHPKIADMGLSTRIEQGRSSFDSCQVGSVGWHAPELMTNGRLTKSVDIFSLGCIIHYVLTGGRHPFGDGFERDSNILQGKFNLRRIEHMPEAVDLVQSMIIRDPEQRASTLEIIRHPFFWSDDMRLDFLQAMSDRIEVEKPDSFYRNTLEKHASHIVTRSWDRVLDASLLENLGKYRKYNFGSIRDCLRVIRNKKNHYRDLPPDVKQALGEYPSGFLRYFTSRFPSLLLYSHAFAGHYFRNDMKNYFLGLSNASLKKRWQLWSCASDDGSD